MRAAKVDANQRAIVAALRKAGCRVYVSSSFGKGFPDLIVGFPGRETIALVEIKDGSKPPSARKLTDDQVTFHAEWYGWPLFVVTSVDEALGLVQESRLSTKNGQLGNVDTH